jgi:hypothetical protein
MTTSLSPYLESGTSENKAAGRVGRYTQHLTQVPLPGHIKLLRKIKYKDRVQIRIGFNTDPDPVFFFNTVPDTGSQTIVDLRRLKIFVAIKVNFL